MNSSTLCNAGYNQEGTDFLSFHVEHPSYMVQPTVLKKRHSLKGVKLLPVLRKIRGGKPEGLKGFSRVSKEKKTENLEFEEIDVLTNSLTGENAAELLEFAGRDVAVDEARWMLHCLIIFANEVGQPKGQALDDSMLPGTSTSVGDTGASLESSGPPVAKERRLGDDTSAGSLEERISSLEKSAKVEMIKELKEKPSARGYRDAPVHTTHTQTDYICPAVLSCLCCFWPLGLVAIIYAAEANWRAKRNDLHGAERAGNRSWNLTVASAVIGILSLSLFVIERLTNAFSNIYHTHFSP